MKSNTIQHFAKWDSSPDHSTNLHSFLLIMILLQKVWYSCHLDYDQASNRFTDLSLRFFIYSIQTKWNMCELHYLEAILPQAVFVDDGWLNYSSKVLLLLTVGARQSEKCQCQDSMRALGALASSKQLLQKVCSLSHFTFSTLLVKRAIKQQRRHRQAHFISKRKIREVGRGTGSFITRVPLLLTLFGL